jgi:hypothetical protein
MKIAFRTAWSRGRGAMREQRAPADRPGAAPPLAWDRLCGHSFGREIATLLIDGRMAELVLERSARPSEPAELVQVARLTLAS